MVGEFTENNCQVIACSVDSHFSHLAWNNMPRKAGGLGGVEYPMLADFNKAIAEEYGVLIGKLLYLRYCGVNKKKQTLFFLCNFKILIFFHVKNLGKEKFHMVFCSFMKFYIYILILKIPPRLLVNLKTEILDLS